MARVLGKWCGKSAQSQEGAASPARSPHTACTRILFVTQTCRNRTPYRDPSSRYRCYHAAHDLAKVGCLADVVGFVQLTPDLLNRYDGYVFHRPAYCDKLARTLDQLRRFGRPFLADYDDLIFDARHALFSPAFRTGRLSAREVLAAFEQNHRALRLFRHISVSTAPLREQVLDSHPASVVQVVHNGLSSRWVARLPPPRFDLPSPRGTTIGYFSGTRSHDHDFATVESVLLTLLEGDRTVQLLVVGPLTFQASRFPRAQVVHLAAVDYFELPKYIQRCAITIAPLEDNVFNRCKSGLKFFESAILGVPAVATPIPDMLRFEPAGLRFADHPGDWMRILNDLKQPDLRLVQAHTAFHYARQRCSSLPHSLALLEFLQSAHS